MNDLEAIKAVEKYADVHENNDRLFLVEYPKGAIRHVLDLARIAAQQSKELTQKQKDMVEAIALLSKRNHFPPTYKELAAHLGIKNRMTVLQHLRELRFKGYVTWIDGQNRTLRVIKNV